MAYATHHSAFSRSIFTDPRLAGYMDSVRQGVVFFLRPHQGLLVQDGVRETLEWEDVLRIDGRVKLMLEMYDVPYISMASLSMQERVRTVLMVLGLVGLSKEKESSAPPNRELQPADRRLRPAVAECLTPS